MVTSVSRIRVMTRSKRRSYWPACHCRVTRPGRGGDAVHADGADPGAGAGTVDDDAVARGQAPRRFDVERPRSHGHVGVGDGPAGARHLAPCLAPAHAHRPVLFQAPEDGVDLDEGAAAGAGGHDHRAVALPSFPAQHYAARRYSKRSGYLVFAFPEQHGATVSVGVELHP